MNVKELIEKSVMHEDKSQKFYLDALKHVTDPAAKVWLKELAAEEVKHKEMLLNFDTSKVMSFKPGETQDLHISEFLVDKDVSEIKDFQDVLIIAMKKEQKSYNFYVSMSQSTDSMEMKKMCRILAQEELKHKHKLEVAYDDMVFSEN